jgi:hypothetical protein
MAGCMATLRPLIECAWRKALSLRSSASRTAAKSPLAEIGMTSSNEEGGDDKCGHVAQLSRSTGDIPPPDSCFVRMSQSTGRGSTECILPRNEEQNTLRYDKSLELC